MTELYTRHCSPCAPGSPSLSPQQCATFRAEVPEWQILSPESSHTAPAPAPRLQREYRFRSYLAGVEWVRTIAQLADQEDHHPDILLRYKRVRVELWTHTVRGLSENDFILAAKFDQAYQGAQS
jgi:4a-hydroxytetrahydrobiopterin dehydratase